MLRNNLLVPMANALVLWASLAVAEAPKEAKKDPFAAQREKLSGLWKLEKEIRDGVELKQAPDIQLTFKDEMVILTEDGKAMEAKFKIDPSKAPATMDITIKDGEREDTIRAVYEVDGDTLKVAFSKEGGPRPEKLESAVGSKVTFGIFKRVKK